MLNSMAGFMGGNSSCSNALSAVNILAKSYF
jgi:hypothetical protein